MISNQKIKLPSRCGQLRVNAVIHCKFLPGFDITPGIKSIIFIAGHVGASGMVEIPGSRQLVKIGGTTVFSLCAITIVVLSVMLPVGSGTDWISLRVLQLALIGLRYKALQAKDLDLVDMREVLLEPASRVEVSKLPALTAQYERPSQNRLRGYEEGRSVYRASWNRIGKTEIPVHKGKNP
jgi:hypothetical protein